MSGRCSAQGTPVPRLIRSCDQLLRHLQEMAFFDRAENTSGSLTARLGVDTASIRGAVGDQVGVLAQNLTTFVAAYAIAFSSGWKMTLVITAVLPLLLFSTLTEAKFMQGFANEVALLSV